MTAAAPAPKATSREWIGLAVLALPALPCLLYSMDLTILHLAIPKISADLKPSSAQLLWIIDIYGFLVAGSLITMGTLGDRLGRRKLLLIGAAAFGIASVIAAFSNSAMAAVPAGIPPDAAAAARDTLGAAVAVAAQLPAQLGAALIDAAREAFIQGLQVAAAASAIGSIGLAIFVIVWLRDVGASAPAEAGAVSELGAAVGTGGRQLEGADR